MDYRRKKQKSEKIAGGRRGRKDVTKQKKKGSPSFFLGKTGGGADEG